MNNNEFRRQAVIAAMQGMLGSYKLTGAPMLKDSIAEVTNDAHDIAEALLAEETKRHGATGDWIEWNGGECPVDPDTVVEVVRRDGLRMIREARGLRWKHLSDDYPTDIIRYRVVV